MEKKDLKLENANVRVSNANQVDKVYSIEANFNTSNHALTSIDNGTVRKDGNMIAQFYKRYDGSEVTTYTFYGNPSREEKVDIMGLVEDFELAAEAVVLTEVNE